MFRNFSFGAVGRNLSMTKTCTIQVIVIDTKKCNLIQGRSIKMTQISNIIMQQKQKIMETVDRVTTRAQAALFGGNRA